MIKKGPRLTLGIKFVLTAETVKERFKYLLEQLKRLEIETECLYLDRGFGVIEVARYLKKIEQQAIIACPIRGKTGGLKALCVGKKSYRIKHIFKRALRGPEKVEMAMFKGFTRITKKGKEIRKAKWLAYMLAYMLIEAGEKPSPKTVEKKVSEKVWNRVKLPL